MTSSVPNLHNTKGKRHSSSLLKAFQIRLFFNTSIFHFIGTLSRKINIVPLVVGVVAATGTVQVHHLH